MMRSTCFLCDEPLEALEAGVQKHPSSETCLVEYTDGFGVSLDEQAIARLAFDGEPPDEDEEHPEPSEFFSELDIRTFPYVEEVLLKIFAKYGIQRLGGVSTGRGWSAFNTFQRCRYLYKRRYLTPIETINARVDEPEARAVGTVIHSMLAVYYTRMIEESYPLTPQLLRDEMLSGNANPEIVNEGYRVFNAYGLYYQSEEIMPLAVEYDLKDPRTGESCRFDLIAFFPKNQNDRLAGTYNVEHKCLIGSSRIYDCRIGGYRSVASMFSTGDSPVVLALDQKTHQLVEAQATTLSATGIRDVFAVTLESGRQLKCSDNHPLLTPRGWRPAGELKQGDWVAIPRSTGRKLNRELSVLGRFVGMMLGDGHVSSQIGFTQVEGPVLDAFYETAKILGFAYTTTKTEKRGVVQVRFSVGVGAPVQTLMVRLGLIGRTSGDKFVPEELKRDEHVPSLLGGLWDTDGCVHVRVTDAIISYTTKSIQLARDVQELLLRMGVDSIISKTWATSWSGERNTYYQVKIVGRSSKRRFLVAILEGEIPSARLQDKAREGLQVLRSRDNEVVPVELVRVLIESRYRELHWEDPRRQHIVTMLYKHRSGSPTAVTVGIVREWAEVFPELTECLWEVFWDRVDSVLISGREMLYDLEVPDFENFVADDFIVHNSSSRFDDIALNGWANDGEILGQMMLWDRLKLGLRFGPLRGTIVNILGKQKDPKFHRTTVPPETWQKAQHARDLKFWEAEIQHAKAVNYFPRSRAACIDRFGKCDLYDHCSGEPDQE